MILAFKFRVKDKNHRKALREQQWKVNLVWNYCVEFQRSCVNFWPSHYELNKATQDLRREYGIHSDTCSQICKQFVQSRNTHKKCPKFRSMRKHLGWVPFIRRAVQLKGDAVTFQKRRYRFWRHRDFNEQFKTGCFVQESDGKWYVTFQTETKGLPSAPESSAIGIDLGLKDMATLSDGTKITADKFYRGLEDKLAIAQRAGNKKRVKGIHRKITNRRNHALHVASKHIAERFETIIVGDVNSSALAKTNMAKSVLDAGWYKFKEQLRYKARRHEGFFKIVNEAWTTQTCHECGSIAGPKGQTGLNERDWVCRECGCEHDRDVNAALNILSRGLEHQPLVEESPCL